MNVKSFVNGLDPENTVKGYYDENDQLVLVEPEGSGGGDSDFTTAKATITGFGESTPSAKIFNDGLIVVDKETDELFTVPALPDGVYDIVLYKGKQNCGISKLYLGDSVTVTGGYEDDTITGDITVTLENK